MIPRHDESRRLQLLEHHLLQRRLAQQLAAANVRHLQAPSSTSTASAATALPSASAVVAAAAAAAAAEYRTSNTGQQSANHSLGGREAPPTVINFPQAQQQQRHLPQQQSQQLQQQQQQQQSQLLQRLLAVEQQERKLKRRLSEMHYQQQIQNQQNFLLQATEGSLVSKSHDPKKKDARAFQNTTTTTTAAASLSNAAASRSTYGRPSLPQELLSNLQQKGLLHSSAPSMLQQYQQQQQRGEDTESRETHTEAKDYHGRDDCGRDDDEGRDQHPTEEDSVSVHDDDEDGHDEDEKPAAAVTKKDARWISMYEELKVYRIKTGSCTVPRGFPENPRLASWVAEQRKQYKLMKDGRQSSITPDRVEMLNQIDFAWNAQEAAWEKHMKDLNAFRTIHGHCHCPLGDPDFPKLGLWVKEQRRHFTLMKQGKQSHMTEARCAELDAVGFCWDTHEATWLERLNELREFKAKNGHCTVPTSFPENPKLGTWIHHQRRQYKKYKEGKPCHITAERIRALDSLGFVWHPRDKSTTTDDGFSAVEGRDQPDDLTDLDLRPRKRQRSN